MTTLYLSRQSNDARPYVTTPRPPQWWTFDGQSLVRHQGGWQLLTDSEAVQRFGLKATKNLTHPGDYCTVQQGGPEVRKEQA